MKFSGLIDAFRPAEGPPPTQLLGFIRWALAGAWPVLIIAAVISALGGFLESGTALVLGWIIDAAQSGGPDNILTGRGLWALLAGFAFFLIIRPVVFGLNTVMNSVVIAPNVNPLVLSRLHRWTIGQSVGFFNEDFAGRLAQKQMTCARSLTDVTVETINVVAFALASILGTLAVLSGISWGLTGVFLIWLAGYIATIRYALPRIRQRAAKRAGAQAMVSGQVVDTITNIATVKLFAHAEREDAAALEAIDGFRDRALEFARLAAKFRIGLFLLAGLLPVLMVGGAVLAWRTGAASQGDIVAAGVVSVRIAQMTGWVSFALMGIYSSLGEVEDGMRTLAPAMRLEEGARALEVRAGTINFDNVDFAYGRDAGGVQGIALSVKAGEKLGIVGPSGAGKSTLVALLLRLYDPEAGRITIDGQDIRDVTEESLRRQIGMVTQETALFNRSARENVLYGKPEADEAALREAARRAEAAEFIDTLEDGEGRKGYDAHLGERGVKLSGGQRQRIALARAILKDAPILVLDEATSALDSEAEAAIQSALEEVMQGKTVLAIAHRLSTIAAMDRIIVMREGRIIEEGSHEALLARGGAYAELWARQSGGFLES